MGAKEQVEIRQILVDEIEADIIGPRKGKNEILKINPKNEYLAGVFYPTGLELDEDDEIKESNSGNDDEDADLSVSNDNLFKPSSFGLTCRLVSNTKQIVVRVEYGTYKNIGNYKFERTPRSEKFIIDIAGNQNKNKFDTHPEFTIRYKAFTNKDNIIFNIYVVNNAKRKGKDSFKDIMFQPNIVLESVDNTHIFIEDVFERSNKWDEEDLDMNLLFHSKVSFGKGHLCAVTWDEKNVKERKSSKIQTTFIPKQTVERIAPVTPKIDCINMIKIANCIDKSMLKNILQEVITLYSDWISYTEKKLSDGIVEEKYIKNAEEAVRNCRKTVARMQKSIEVIIQNNNAFEAFKFANLSIAWQQTMSKWAKENATIGEVKGQEPSEPDKAEWRLFQIAFILLNIESLINTRSEDRDTVDLLWFPTGGGKTEAYLGLAVFLIAYRRLNGKNERGKLTSLSLGTSVLMRYTLRLLTVQQFQRAATLMCACEKIRRNDIGMWGEEPFQVGLWVGGSVTPNKRKEGERSALAKKRQLGKSDLTHIRNDNPYILINCPWCGKKINTTNGEVGGEPEQWRLYCGRNQCMFSKHLDIGKDLSLPVVLVDEDVYTRCPALIIGTVDKFAQITWKPECSSIFGHVKKYCNFCGFYNSVTAKSAHNHPERKNKDPNFKIDVELLPPDLIIQDELHLISGPLGSMVGIYETAIEHLCTNNNIKPKIIASTATTKKSGDQIQNLFNRSKTMIFPPQVIEFGDTFFSKSSMELGENKMYIGVLGTGKSGMNVLTRISAVILRRIRQLAESNTYGLEDLDPYFSLVTYFNSQRELGGASMGFKDSVPELIYRIKNQFEESMDSKSMDKSLGRILGRQFRSLDTEELTSRKSSGEIPEILRKLDNNMSADPVDLLLATNMLSVGVDIARLGTMIVTGQPKNHSEYIQATGRIGRRHPGLIVTIYAYTKPRDLSHYENFKAYHATLFKNVEASSITPFTVRTREIALFGVLVGLLRMKSTKFSQNIDAGKFDLKDIEQYNMVEEIKTIFRNRVSMIDNSESENTIRDIEKLIRRWTRYVKKYSDGLLKFANSYDYRTAKELKDTFYYLLKTDPASTKELIPTPTSLRNAEQEQRLFYLNVDADNEADENE